MIVFVVAGKEDRGKILSFDNDGRRVRTRINFY